MDLRVCLLWATFTQLCAAAAIRSIHRLSAMRESLRKAQDVSRLTLQQPCIVSFIDIN
jgi:hypothetical protein